MFLRTLVYYCDVLIRLIGYECSIDVALKGATLAKHLKQLERIVRGFSNHRRIEILQLLEAKGDLDVTRIAQALSINFKTCSEHTRRLAVAGLIYKRPEGQSVLQQVSPRGKKVLMFLRTLE
jgi:ArsR family transcriptional regulator, virulence genes transcriptional regulator